jgi:hypothetical protein
MDNQSVKKVPNPPKRVLLLLLVLMALPHLSFRDFLNYWTVKVNGKTVYNSSTSKDKNLFIYEVDVYNVSPKDSIAVEFFSDSPCHDCIHYYFMGEYSSEEGKPYLVLSTYLNEQKSFGPAPYKKAIADLLNAGEKGNFKVIYYYTSERPKAMPLCAIREK